MKSRFEIITKILKEKNIKLTYQRQEIIKIFLNGEKHYRPEVIYNCVKNKGIGLATVYRTIQLLQENDIINEISIGKDRYFELKIFSSKYLHIHFKCDKCNKIEDYDNTKVVLDLIELRNFTEKHYNIAVHDIIVVMNGICEQCRR